MARKLSAYVSFAALLAFNTGTAFAATVSFFDGTFAPADWAVIPYKAGGSWSVTQSPTGGNPGAYQSVTIGQTPLTDLEIVSPFSYTPSLQGPIAYLNMSMDAINLGYTGQGDGLLIQQGGNFWYAGYVGNNATTWHSISISNMASAGWSGSGAPDFSSTGGTIRFGYFAANSQSSSVAGIDNFSVTLDTNPVPEPLSVMVLGVGVIGLLAVRRRRT